MDKTEYIKYLIKETGLNIRAFAKEADIPYTTLRSMLDRGIENASVNNVIKICARLGIQVEKLYAQSTVSELSDISIGLVNNGLADDEIKLLNNYKILNDLGKKEATKRVGELACIDKYTNKPLTIAAHHKDGITPSQEDVNHDLDILLNDKNWE